MRTLFYIGAMISLIAVALFYWKNWIGGAILLSVGVALILIGFLGIVTNFAVSNRMKQRR